jgi:hypothetical protein
MTAPDPGGAWLQVRRGMPTDTEMAALVAILLAVRRTGPATSGGGPAGGRARPGWKRHVRYRAPGSWTTHELG